MRTARATTFREDTGGSLSVVPASRPAPVSPGRSRSAERRQMALQNAADAICRTGVDAVVIQYTCGAESVAVRNNETRYDRPVVPLRARFRAGGTTRVFVATVVLQLVAEGRLELDADASRWLPVTPGITVRHLLQETSGLADYLPRRTRLDTAESFAANRFRSYGAAQLVAAAGTTPGHEPGTRFAYSATNYVLLGMLIRELTGNPWEVEVARRIVHVLGLTGTVAPGGFPYIMGSHAESYVRFTGDGPRVNTTLINPSLFDAAGSMITTADDLSRFLHSLIGGELLPQGVLSEMLKTVPVNDLESRQAPGSRYGLGLFWYPLPTGGGYWGHRGEILGFHTYNGVTADGERSVVVAMNSLGRASGRKAAAVLDRNLGTSA